MIRSQKYFAIRLVRLWCCLLLLQSSLFVAVHGQSTCILSINELESEESQVTDFSVERLYTLCPQTTYTIGRQDYYGTVLYETGSHMIHLRPNLHIQCGDTGARSNNCIISGGTVQVDGTSFYVANATGSTTLSNVKMTGLTFTNVGKYHVWIDQPGEVTLLDCAFQDSTDAILPIFMDYFDPTSSTSVLNVTIHQCEFLDNRYYGIPAQAALIVGNSKQNHLTVTDSNFTRNDMIFNNTNYERASFLIESSGPVELMRNCFQHNSLGVAPVGVYGSTIVATDNFQYNSTGGVCQMSAYFTASSYASFTPICASFDSPNCKAIVGSNVPTSPPVVSTLSPTTTAPVNSTTFAPSAAPTVPLIVSGPTLIPAPVVGNITNGTASPPAKSPSSMVFWTAAPVAASETNSPVESPVKEVQFNATSSSHFIQHLTWSSILIGALMMEIFSM